MSRHRTLSSVTLAALWLVTACGSTGTPSPSPTSNPSAPATSTPTSTPTSGPLTTAAATSTELNGIAAMVYLPCTPSTCTGAAMFTTCEAGSSSGDVFASCPFTSRLTGQLRTDIAGVPSAPDPLGGGQDPEWTTETFDAAPSSTGGTVHVTLGFGAATTPERIDLLIVLQGSQLLVDDIYCTGADPATGDAFAPGWLARSNCLP